MTSTQTIAVPTQVAPSIWQRLASRMASSVLFKSAKELHENNPNDWHLGGSFTRKLMTNLYLILRDYGLGVFPPKLVSREATFASERKQQIDENGAHSHEIIQAGLGKPFTYPAHMLKHYCWSYLELLSRLERLGIMPGARILELGCGFGWTSEFLAIRGYHVTGTTLVSQEVTAARKRTDSVRIKGLDCQMDFVTSPMEEVSATLGIGVNRTQKFDAVFCLEALHHAFDWRTSLNSATECLKPGGYLLICSEPSAIHTYICYRSAKVLKTHEIGFKHGVMEGYLANLGYQDIEVARPVRIDKVSDFWKRFVPCIFEGGSLMARGYWIVARKPE